MEEDKKIDMEETNIRIGWKAETERMNVSVPGWLLALIDQEAKEKGKTRSLTAAYLIYSGLKAHVGEFMPPANNTIKANYLKRGKQWR